MKKACNFIKKESLTQVFFGEFFKISNNSFFTEHLWMAVLKIEITLVLIQFSSIQVKPGFYLAMGSPNQLTWTKPASRPTLPNFTGSFKKSKKPSFHWVCWVCCQSNKTYRAGFTSLWVLEPSQLTIQVTWVQGTQLTQLTT